jgi:hypothetical protein
MRFILLFVILLSVVNDVFTQKLIRQNGYTIKISKNIVIDLPIGNKITGEPHLSIDPTNPNYLLAAVMIIDPNLSDSIYGAILISIDGGATWKNKMLDYGTANDPWTLITSKGIFVVTTLYKNGMLVHRSADKGQTWMEPIFFEGANKSAEYDHETMTTNEDGNRVYIVAQSQRRINKEYVESLFIAESVDGGISFPTSRKIPVSNLQMTAFTAVLTGNNQLLIPYSLKNYDYTDSFLKMNEGIHQLLILDSLYQPEFFPRFITNKEGKSFPVMIITKHKERERLLYVFNNYDQNQIHLMYSDNYGKQWHSDTILFNKEKQKVFFPQLSTTKNGRLGVAWFKKDSLNLQDVCFSFSDDLGETFSPVLIVNDKKFNNDLPGNGWTTKRNFANAGGHYFGFVSKGENKFEIMWCDSRTGKLKLYISEIEILKD